MVELIVFGSVVATLGGLTYGVRRRLKLFNSHADDWECTLQQFMKLHNIKEFDIKLSNSTEIPCEKKDSLKFVARSVNKGYDFIVCELTKGYSFPTHLHFNSSEFFYVISGKIQIKSEDHEDYIIGPGDYAYITNKTNHSFLVIDNTTCIIVAVPSMIGD